MGREGCQEVQEREIQSALTGEKQPVHKFSLEICFVAQEKMKIHVIVSQQFTHVTREAHSMLGCIRKVSPACQEGWIYSPLFFSSVPVNEHIALNSVGSVRMAEL